MNQLLISEQDIDSSMLWDIDQWGSYDYYHRSKAL
jgi:hypothetical protein